MSTWMSSLEWLVYVIFPQKHTDDQTDGCSGAEVASICQDAALAAMNDDLDAAYVKKEHLLHSAKTVRRRITPDMIHFFESWRDQSGVRSA
jgi:AAA family ATPase